MGRTPPVEVLLFIVFFLLFVLVGFFAHQSEQKRLGALERFAVAQGWSFSTEQEREWDARFPEITLFNTGHSRYAANFLRGDFHGHWATICDYHYAQTTSNGKSTTTTHYHYTCYVLELPRRFGWLNVTKEGFLAKLAQAVGFDDIDFESAEFSRRYCVHAGSKKFAYDVIHVGMMEFLLAHPGLYFSVSGRHLLISYKGQQKAEKHPARLRLLLGIRERFPEYLLTD